jgi:hypothetical protein
MTIRFAFLARFLGVLNISPAAVQSESSDSILDAAVSAAVDRDAPAMIELRRWISISIPNSQTANSFRRCCLRTTGPLVGAGVDRIALRVCAWNCVIDHSLAGLGRLDPVYHLNRRL